MDELKLSLSTKFMKGIVAKLIARAIRKKVGCDIDILLNNVSLKHDGGRVYIHVDVDAEMDSKDLTKLTKLVDKD